MGTIVENILGDDSIQALIESRETAYVEKELGQVPSADTGKDVERNFRIVSLLLGELLDGEDVPIEKSHWFNSAYAILKSYRITNPTVSVAFDNVFGVEDLSNSTLYYFYLAALALNSDETIRIRLDLKEFSPLPFDTFGDNWKARVLNGAFDAFILLVRKKDGYADIRQALEIVNDLKESQKAFEEDFLNKSESELAKVEQAYQLLGIYHLTKTITATADYLIQGYGYKGRLESEVRSHSDMAKKLFAATPRLQSLANILERALGKLQRNSIWFSTNSIQIRKLREFCEAKSLAERSLIDLLPSQRDALKMNLLDIASNVTVVEMPTSSGKTLLAEFNIIVTKALNADSKIVYVVPSRALVNQVYNDLKADLAELGFSIEKTSSAIEIDPSENQLLQGAIDILVSTPEKLDLLIRRQHPSVEDVALFVIDEAHMIQNGQRGAKLELLLSILKRERPNSRFMFLSPFLKDSGEIIADWIASGKIKTSIQVNWKPAKKLLIGIKQRNEFKEFTQTLLPSAYLDFSQEKSLDVVTRPRAEGEGKPRDRYNKFAAETYGAVGKSLLFLCQGPGMADKRAKNLAAKWPQNRVSETAKLVRNFIQDEVGKETILSSVLTKGIAVHHAGLSDETKLLVEHLIRIGEIRFIFATSTLAEGVNFPVSGVYFDTYKRGPKHDMSVNDFWNIAGRAGRTMIDNFGKLIFPFDSRQNTSKARALVNESSRKIASVLLEFMSDADEILDKLQTAKKSPLFKLAFEYPDSLGPLIQYLIHLLRSSDTIGHQEIEDLFKDSLGYYQLESPEQKRKFVNVCKAIYSDLQRNFKRGTLSFADQTGFSVPSVLEMMNAENRKNPAIASAESWEPKNLFNSNEPYLAEKIRVIAKLRETGLGTDSRNAEFSEEAVARILIGWIKGEQLFEVSKLHPSFVNIKDEAHRINTFVKYINDARFKASWGLGALEGIIQSSEGKMKENSYVPSFVYFGVDNKEALLMRMVGVPRRLANSLTKVIDMDELAALSTLRKRIDGLSNADWDAAAPTNSSLSGQEWKRLTEVLVN